MRLTCIPNGWKDSLYWQEHDRKILQRVKEVIRDTLSNPLSGIGKPEPLRNNLKGWWSRRFPQEHRLIYKVEGDSFPIMQCRFHDDDLAEEPRQDRENSAQTTLLNELESLNTSLATLQSTLKTNREKRQALYTGPKSLQVKFQALKNAVKGQYAQDRAAAAAVKGVKL